MTRLLLLLTACVAANPPPDVAAQGAPEAVPAVAEAPLTAAPSAAVDDPAAVYTRYCALCHGADREGYAADHAPSLRSPELLGAASPLFLQRAVAFGRPGTAMAAFAADQGGPLSDSQQAALIDWLIRSAQVTPAPIAEVPIAGEPRRGAEVYRDHCATCHGERGQGRTGTALANPVLLATASDAFLRHTVAQGRSGTPMVGFAGVLSDADLDAVVTFLRGRASGWDTPSPVQVQAPDLATAVINPEGPIARLDHREGRFVSAASVAAALARGERMVLLDARPVSDWQRSHIPGALPVPFYDGVAAIGPHLPKDGTPLVAYCACPHAASGVVVDKLVALGFPAARILDEGVLFWGQQNYPLVPAKP